MSWLNKLSIAGIWNSGTPAPIDETNRLPVSVDYSAASIGNSTLTPLGAGATFTGTAEINGYPSVLVSCFTDQDGTMSLQFSNDGGVNWDSQLPKNLTAGLNEFHISSKGYRHFRIVITNTSASAQTVLRLSVSYGSFSLKVTSLNGVVRDDDDAIVVRSIEHEEMVVENKYQGRFIINKQGLNPDIDIASVPEDIWAAGGVYTGFPTGSPETLTVLSTSANDTGAGTGARTFQISGLDTNYNLQNETVTLNGLGGVNTVNKFRRVYSARVLTAGTAETNIGDITIRHTTTVANVFALVLAGRGQTNLSNYTIPAGYKGYIKRIGAQLLDNNTNRLEMCIWRRPFGGAVRLVNPFSVTESAQYERNVYGGIVFTEKEDFVIRCISALGNDARLTVNYDLLVVKD